MNEHPTDRAASWPVPDQHDLVFNAVYVPRTFRHLHPFLISLVESSQVRVRLVANGCPPTDLEQMAAVADQYPGRIEVLSVSSGERREHGEVLNELYPRDADTGHFCFVDTDVLTTGPWIERVLDAMTRHVALSAAHPTWDPDPRAPADEAGLRGHYVFGNDGWLFGSSYLAVYRRGPVDEIVARWGVDFRRETHAGLRPDTRERMTAVGGPYSFYDTAKLINSLLQLDGYPVGYLADLPVLHIGSMSILEYMTTHPWEEWPDPGNAARIPDKCARDTVEIAATVSAYLIELVDGTPPGRVPPLTDPTLQGWFADHQATFRGVMERFRRVP